MTKPVKTSVKHKVDAHVVHHKAAEPVKQEVKAKVEVVTHEPIKPVVELVTLPKHEVEELLGLAQALGDWHLPVHGRAMIMGKVGEWRERNRETLES